MAITEVNPPGRQVIERYGPGGFRIAGRIFTGPVLVLPQATIEWAAADLASATPESFRPLVESGAVEILLIGTGRSMRIVPAPLRAALRAAGLRPDAMDTGAACRTYNVLLGEERRVGAALLPMRF